MGSIFPKSYKTSILYRKSLPPPKKKENTQTQNCLLLDLSSEINMYVLAVNFPFSFKEGEEHQIYENTAINYVMMTSPFFIPIQNFYSSAHCTCDIELNIDFGYYLQTYDVIITYLVYSGFLFILSMILQITQRKAPKYQLQISR